MSNNIKLIYIRWEDATGSDGWIRADRLIEAEKLATIHTVGYLVHEDAISVTLSMAHDVSNNNFGAYMSIPKSCIKKRKTLTQ